MPHTSQKSALDPKYLDQGWYESSKKIQYQYQAGMEFFENIQYQ